MFLHGRACTLFFRPGRRTRAGALQITWKTTPDMLARNSTNRMTTAIYAWTSDLGPMSSAESASDSSPTPSAATSTRAPQVSIATKRSSSTPREGDEVVRVRVISLVEESAINDKETRTGRRHACLARGNPVQSLTRPPQRQFLTQLAWPPGRHLIRIRREYKLAECLCASCISAPPDIIVELILLY